MYCGRKSKCNNTAIPQYRAQYCKCPPFLLKRTRWYSPLKFMTFSFTPEFLPDGFRQRWRDLLWLFRIWVVFQIFHRAFYCKWQCFRASADVHAQMHWDRYFTIRFYPVFMMSHDFKSNSSPYSQKGLSHNRLSKNYFFWKFTEDFGKKQIFFQ